MSFDQNLSPTLAQKLADLFPGSTHTERAGLGRSDDVSIWEFCLREGFVVVSKDNDFGFLAMQRYTTESYLYPIGKLHDARR
jgi:predicted nuclease of predicted toxin-antitoxin system